MTLSAESKNGSPNEAGTPVMRHSAMPPIESPSRVARPISLSNSAGSL